MVHSVTMPGLGDKYTLYGSNKDSTSFYLELFPAWKLSITPVEVQVDATEIRELYFKGHQTAHFLHDHPHVSLGTIEAMKEFKFNPDLQEEYEYYKKEGANFAGYPYPSCLNVSCGDSVVVVNGKVLMVRRKKVPGKGCIALPGGHKENNETYVDAAIRELIEEAQIGVSKDLLYDNIVGCQVFDDPNRSEGPLTRITVGVLIDLSSLFEGDAKPEVFANDDAMEVLWVDLEELYQMANVYDDHAKIVHDLATTFL
jgi:bifunctional NMN adenylyltransferase/nudix hydrolase